MQSLVNPGFGQTSLAGDATSSMRWEVPLIRPALGLAVLLFDLLMCRDAAAASFSNATALITARGSQTLTLRKIRPISCPIYHS
jgi:hypothetical protein